MSGVFLLGRVFDKLVFSALTAIYYWKVGRDFSPVNVPNIAGVLFLWCAPLRAFRGHIFGHRIWNCAKKSSADPLTRVGFLHWCWFTARVYILATADSVEDLRRACSILSLRLTLVLTYTQGHHAGLRSCAVPASNCFGAPSVSERNERWPLLTLLVLAVQGQYLWHKHSVMLQMLPHNCC